MAEKPKAPSPGDMAYLVGEALRANGIKVRQTKEKFGSVRVYVDVPNTHEARLAYREVYLSAMRACPALSDNLHRSADYPEWLFKTEEELDDHIARFVTGKAANALEAWDPRFKLARMLIRGQDTTSFNTTEDED